MDIGQFRMSQTEGADMDPHGRSQSCEKTLESTAGVPVRAQDNAERLHAALDRMENILKVQQHFIDKLAGEDDMKATCEDEERQQTPSMIVLLQGAPTAIDGVIDRAIKNMDVIREMIYG